MNKQQNFSLDFLEQSEIKKDHFFSEFWRTKPVYLKTPSSFLELISFSDSEFERFSERLAKVKPEYVSLGGNGVVFLQNLNLVSDRFDSICSGIEAIYSLQNTWFDSVRTIKGSAGGIGSHFDHSDNFVFQISGAKTWRLHPSSAIPADLVRKRMVGERGVGSFPMPPDALEFRLHEGDFLYIPLNWIHEGISNDDSMSLSWVCNTETALDTLLPLIRQVLKQSDIWCDALSTDILVSEAELFDKLFAEIDNPVFRDQLKSAWTGMLMKRQ